MPIYRGLSHSDGVGGQLVMRDDTILTPDASQGIHNHSPDGFNWGYGGSGPAQLALALLLDVTGDPAVALAHHQDFKWQYVAGWPKGSDWEISSEEIEGWIRGGFVRETA